MNFNKIGATFLATDSGVMQRYERTYQTFVNVGLVLLTGILMTALCNKYFDEIQKDFSKNQQQPVSNLKKIKDISILAGLCIGVNTITLLWAGPAAAVTVVAFSILGIVGNFLPENIPVKKISSKIE